MSNQRRNDKTPRRKDRNQTSSQYSNNGHDISFRQTMRGNRDYHNPSSQDRRDDCCCGVAAVVGVGVVAAAADCATGGTVTAAALSAVDPITLATHCRDCCDATSHILNGGAQYFGSILGHC